MSYAEQETMELRRALERMSKQVRELAERVERLESAEKEARAARIAELDAERGWTPEIRDLRAELAAERDVKEKEKALRLLGSVAFEMERAIHEAERPKGGQQVSPSGGDFWPIGVGVVQRFRWWVREIRRVMPREEE